MRETNFIKQNKQKWQEFEQMLHVKDKDPDKLSDLFVQITDDLSYAKTFYTNRSVRYYLNNLASQVFYNIYKGKKTGWKNLKHFWTYDLPKAVYESRKALLLSLTIFILATVIGIFSSAKDPDFVKSILGKAYVEMTKENIKSGDPMAVYKKMNQTDMFMGISVNNLKVAFFTFVLGIFCSVGTILIMLRNGIMVGAFQYFFYEKGLFWESFLTIWLHGTLEISAIIIAGGAGLTLGSGLIFPGTYSRTQSLKLTAKKGLTIMMGIFPIIVFAAIIESFITRYTELHPAAKASLILVSLFFIVYYFIVFPFLKARRGEFDVKTEEKLPYETPIQIDYTAIKNNGEIFSGIFMLYKKFISKILPMVLIIAIVYATIVTYLLNYTLEVPLNESDWTVTPAIPLNYFIINLFDYDSENGFLLYILNTICTATLVFYVNHLLKQMKGETANRPIVNFISTFFKALVVAALIHLIFYTHYLLAIVLLVTVLPCLVLLFYISSFENINIFNGIGRMFHLLGGGYGRLIGLSCVMLITCFIYYVLIASPIPYFFLEFIQMNLNLDENEQRMLYIAFCTLISFIGIYIIIPIFYLGYSLSYFSIREIKDAVNLKERILKFGAKTKHAAAK